MMITQSGSVHLHLTSKSKVVAELDSPCLGLRGELHFLILRSNINMTLVDGHDVMLFLNVETALQAADIR